MSKKSIRLMRIIQINMCFFFLLGISLNCRSLSCHTYDLNWSYAAFNNTTGVDISELKNLVDFTGKLELMWIPDSNFSRTANQGINFDKVLNKEDAYFFENWMIHPDSLYTSFINDFCDNEIYTEDEISVEKWMVDTSTWNTGSFRKIRKTVQ